VNVASGAPAIADSGGFGAGETRTIARNVSTRYLAIGVEALLGFAVLPYNVAHLGPAAYGLWMLTGSITAYFSVLDLGYGGALVKFVAQYRARRDIRALNEILSTLFFLFLGFGVLTYVAAIAAAVYLDRLFQIAPEQVQIGRIVLLIISLNVAAGTAFSVFGAVINGFQRYDLNNGVGAVSSVLTAAVNVAVLAAGYGLVELVAATTLVRLLTYGVYRANAYRVFPELRIRPRWFRRERLREVTMFSVYMLLIDWANKLNYSVDAIVIGIFLNTSAVAIWTVGQRLAELVQRLTTQLSDVLFPTVVDHDAGARLERLQAIFVQGTRLSLATVIPMACGVMLMAQPLIEAWVGPGFAASVGVLRLLAFTVIVRIGTATAVTLLKGAGEHRLVAFATLASAVANLALSIAIVRPLGLAGVAIGTLVPVCLASILVVFPAGARRVGLPLTRAFADAVWPAAWPALAMTAFVLATRALVPVRIVPIALELTLASAVYVLVFVFFGLSGTERRVYLAQVADMLQRRAPAAAVTEGA
jgi:O-antigen/teichoic acid export membrane protein